MGAVDNVFFSTAAEAYLHFNLILLHITNISVCEVSLLVTFCVIFGGFDSDDTRGLKRKKNQLLWFLSKLQLVVRC